MDIFFHFFEAIFSVAGFLFASIFFIISCCIFAWWIYTSFYAQNIIATITGVRAYEKDTEIDEDGKEIKTKPYLMYSPLLSCKMPSGAVVNGKINGSQNWLPEKWLIGSKMTVVKSSDDGVFQEAGGYISLFIAIVIMGISITFFSSVHFDIYAEILFGIFLLRMYFKARKHNFFSKLKDFIANKKWREAKLNNPLNKKARSEQEQAKNWRNLSTIEISQVWKKQYNNFFRGTLPFILMFTAGTLFLAYKMAEKEIAQFLAGKPVPEIIVYRADGLLIAVAISLVSFLVVVLILIKAARLSRKKDIPLARLL